MAIGFQTFIEGTSFDVLNAMDYNFVVDVFGVSGNGNRSYNYPGFILKASMTGSGVSGPDVNSTATVTVSGQTVSWTNAGQDSRVYVIAEAVSTISYFGFSLNDYATGKFKLAPNFTPMCLCQVIDLTPTALQTLRTNVPSGMPIVAFHRSLNGTNYNHVFYSYVDDGGYWALRFRDSRIGSPMGATRIYVFSRLMINIPRWGFFLYAPGTNNVVWHGNCLPLKMSAGSVSGSPVPLAITAGISAIVRIPLDPAFPTGPVEARSNCYSACQNTDGTYRADGNDLFLAMQYNTGTPGGFSISPPAVIETHIYDAYYRQALGV